MSEITRRLVATAALFATTAFGGGCDLLDVFTDEGSTLVQLLVTHHATPEDGRFPDLADGEMRTFETDEGWTVYLQAAYVTTTRATLHQCDEGSVEFEPYWGSLPENFGAQDLDLLSFAAAELSAGDYCDLTVEYGAFQPQPGSANRNYPMGEHKDLVEGATYYFKGGAEKDGETIAFELRSDATLAVDLDISTVMHGGPLVITADEPFPIDLTLSKTYDRLFDGIDFTSATQEDLNANVSAVLELETRVAFGTRVSAE